MKRLDGASHGPEINLTVRQLERLGRPKVGHHQFHGQVLDPALDVMIPGMKMAINHASGSQLAVGVNNLVGVPEIPRRLNGSNVVAID